LVPRGDISPLESTRIQEEEVTDIEGYLKPTFAERSQSSPIRPRAPSEVGEAVGGGGVILPESYGQLGGRGSVQGSGRSSGGMSAASGVSRASPSHPLISESVKV